MTENTETTRHPLPDLYLWEWQAPDGEMPRQKTADFPVVVCQHRISGLAAAATDEPADDIRQRVRDMLTEQDLIPAYTEPSDIVLAPQPEPIRRAFFKPHFELAQKCVAAAHKKGNER